MTGTVGRWMRGAALSAGVAGMVLGGSLVSHAAAAPITLTMLTHWDATTAKQFQPYITQYEKLNPGIKINLETVAFNDLLTKISVSELSPNPPDIYHIYDLWLPQLVKSGLLEPTPSAEGKDVQANYHPGTVSAVSYKGKIYGYPTETDDYLLDWNKTLFKKAGISGPPKTWAQLLADAKKLTVKNKSGQVVTEGFGVITNWDAGVVHPFTAMLWSDGGQLFTDHNTKVAFTSTQGKATLGLIDTLVKDGYTVPAMGNAGGSNSNEYVDNFETGKIAMVVMADWWEYELEAAMPHFFQTVGAAPIPVGPSGTKSVSVQYSWMFGVNQHSPHAAQAWAFIKWLNDPANGPKSSSRMGDWLMGQGIIPSRIGDQNAHTKQLGNPFMKQYVNALRTSQPWPLISNGAQAITDLQTQIEAVETGSMSVTAGLKQAKTEIQPLLK